MQVKKPIFIISTPRSGSTIFVRILSHHHNLAFLSYLCNRYPETPWLNRTLMHMIDVPFLQSIIRKKINPNECWNFWRHHVIAGVYRDLLKEDVTIYMKSKVQKILAEMLTKKRNRLLVKITGWPRSGFFKEIFPDAKFIHILRDGRAVANSTLNVDWWEGWQGPHRWGWGELTPEQKKEWEKYNYSFVALACINWKRMIDTFEQAKKNIPPEDFLEIRYEDLCLKTVETFRQVTEFCELDWSSNFEAVINSFKLKTMNFKWKDYLTDPQKKILCECLKDYLEKYGYQI